MQEKDVGWFLLGMIWLKATLAGRSEPVAGLPGWTQNDEWRRTRAAESGLPILALYTGSDWCIQFERVVAH